MADKIKSTAKEEGQRIQKLTKEAVQSQAYLYPIKGIIYYASHRSLWKPLMSKIVPTITMGIGIFTSMFFFTYLPQAAVLAIFNGPIAAITTVLLVLSEASTVFMVSAKTFLIEDSLVDTFDGTLLAKGQTELIASNRQVKSGGDPIARLGKLVSKPFQRFTPSAIIRYFMYLPLNFIPIVGTVIFILLQGKKTGPTQHARYFQLKGMNKSRQEDHVEHRKGAYTSFGVVAVLLEMVPVVGIFFAFTNVVGAALWAADMEASQSTAPALREQAKKAQ
ncbi:Etoposide-induced protein 2.4 (EI24)-like protein [Elsinoe fawcettii]|nr:Etoposide-induced protein 2.4 (EI24)-like protein [Elsinoe fawcettii]